MVAQNQAHRKELLKSQKQNDATDQFLRETMTKPEFLKHIFGQAFDTLDKNLVHLLQVMPQRQLERIYSKLRKLGISDEKITSSPMLLIRDLATLQKNYNFLVKKGFDQQFIEKNAELLCLNPNLLQDPDYLKKLRQMDKRKESTPEGELGSHAVLKWKRSKESIGPRRPLRKPSLDDKRKAIFSRA